MNLSSLSPVPEQGQLVRLRQRFWLTQDVVGYSPTATSSLVHRVQLECLDDDQLGDTLNIIWEREPEVQVYESQGLPEPLNWDAARRFDAFLTAIRWSSSSLLERSTIQAPFHAAIDIEEYQLEPVVRALTMPRANLLIADDVGLGKTIEAGLVIQEMLSRRRIQRILVICPASLQQQWQDEMRDKFQLTFEIIDRDRMQELRREFGVHVNPWLTFPRLITSMDFIKREQPLRLFQEGLQLKDSPLRDWDLLVVDEAHNVAPSGRGHYAIASDRTRMMRAIADQFEHRLFLTATPHNGFTESFTSLLELLDPLRFNRGPTVNRQQVDRVMVRRLKDEIKTALGHRKFAERHVEALTLTLDPDEQRLHELLDAYMTSRLKRLDWADSLPVRFALTMLKKRSLSSPLAFSRSIATHLATLGAPSADESDTVLLQRMAQRVDEDWADDVEKAQTEDDALVESSRFFTDLTPEEQDWLHELRDTLDHPAMPDSKARALIDWIEAHLRPNGEWNDERLIIFTEYKDTLDYLNGILAERYGQDRLMVLMGGMNLGDREVIKAAFQADPDENPVRILVATDAASEGLNLQNHCHYLIHYEIPWNPNRMEQRNGRIDRHGQQAAVVTVYHFLYADRADSQFLQTVVDKVQTMRADLGSVGDVIAAQVEEAMLGRRNTLDLPQRRQALVREVVRSEILTDSGIHEVTRRMDRARAELEIYPDKLAQVLDEALKQVGHEGLLPATDPVLDGQAYRLRNLPDHWREAARTLKDAQGHALDVTFEQDIARTRRDVALLHLNHPLMRQAIGIFRARLWAEGSLTGHDLNRVSYRVLPDTHLPRPVVLAYGRLVAVGSLSQRLHESVIAVGGEIDDRNIYPFEDEDIHRLLAAEYIHPALPTTLAGDLRRLFPFHERALQDLLEQKQAKEEIQLRELAGQRAEEDARAVSALMDERIKELRQRLTHETRDAAPPDQLELFDRDEYRQYEEDLAWLGRRLEELQQRRKAEPDRQRAAYKLRTVRIFPLALLYLLPHRLVRS